MTKERFINDIEENYIKLLAQYQDSDNKFISQCFNKLSYRMLNYISAVRKSNYDMEFYMSSGFAMNYICNSIIELEYRKARNYIPYVSDDDRVEAVNVMISISNLKTEMLMLFVNYEALKDDVEEIKKLDMEEVNERLKDVYIDELKMDDKSLWLNDYGCTKKDIEALELLIGPQREFEELRRNSLLD